MGTEKMVGIQSRMKKAHRQKHAQRTFLGRAFLETVQRMLRAVPHAVLARLRKTAKGLARLSKLRPGKCGGRQLAFARGAKTFKESRGDQWTTEQHDRPFAASSTEWSRYSIEEQGRWTGIARIRAERKIREIADQVRTLQVL